MATHRLTFQPQNGATLKHWLVMLCRDPYTGADLVGVTEDDFRRRRAPTWQYRHQEATWWWQGVPTPLWHGGDVLLEALAGAPAEPQTLIYDGQGGPPSNRLASA